MSPRQYARLAQKAKEYSDSEGGTVSVAQLIGRLADEKWGPLPKEPSREEDAEPRLRVLHGAGIITTNFDTLIERACGGRR